MNGNVTYTKLPVIGKVQHGEKIITNNGKQKTVDYGYFIAKIQESNMQYYLDKFDKIIKGSKSIDIQFLDENPLSIRNERANQSGRVCYCMEGQSVGKQKVKNLWQDIECKPDCTYLQKDDNGKAQCKRIAWLKFFIPQIATDRIWLMKITGQEAIDNLRDYIAIQKIQGNSLRNNAYTIFLTQKEQVNFLGQAFNNYVLDILKKDEFISQNSNSQKVSQTIPITNSDKNVTITPDTQKSVTTSNQTPTNIPIQETIIAEENKNSNQPNIDTKKATSKKATTTKKDTKTKSKKPEEAKDTEESKNEYDDCYVLLRTYTKIVNVNGQPKQYFMAEFTDMNDNISNIAIKPDFANELAECELGTVVRLNIQEVKDKKFAVGLDFVEKHIKKVVA